VKRLLALAALLACAACAHAAAPPPAIAFDPFAVIGAPPAPESPQQAADAATARGPWSAERLAKAVEDDAFDPWTAFDDVLGPDFTAANHPATKRLFDQIRAVAGPAINAAKARWTRARPFVADPAQPTCITPSDALRASGAYPSGHAAMGWAWGLALAELAPAHADALLARGFAYGESRVVCGLHWQSDVTAGRALGAAAVARLHGDPNGRALFAAARTEFAR